MKLDERSSYSLGVFKHGCFFEEKQSRAFVFFKKFQDKSDLRLDFKKWLQFFLLNDSFCDTEFYYFLLTNHDSYCIKEKSQ